MKQSIQSSNTTKHRTYNISGAATREHNNYKLRKKHKQEELSSEHYIGSLLFEKQKTQKILRKSHKSKEKWNIDHSSSLTTSSSFQQNPRVDFGESLSTDLTNFW